jgi:hypothetical protein
LKSTLTCELKTGLFKCGQEAVGLCQYCGRLFCDRHSELLEELQEVCSRKPCVAKRQDLVRHLAYKDAVSARNEQQQCGIEGCSRGFSGQCTRCKGYFCGHHVEVRQETVLQNRVRVPRRATLCQHCWDRRPIWLRQ